MELLAQTMDRTSAIKLLVSAPKSARPTPNVLSDTKNVTSPMDSVLEKHVSPLIAPLKETPIALPILTLLTKLLVRQMKNVRCALPQTQI